MSIITVDCKNLNGNVKVPVSKSILHRYLVCAFVAGDYDVLDNAADKLTAKYGVLPDDVMATIDCLQQLVKAEEPLTLNCRESGTTLRFMVPLVAALGLEADLIAEGNLVGRPMKPFVDELSNHGANISSELVIKDGSEIEVFHVSGKLEEGDYMLPGNISSQFISGMMLASDLVDGELWICTEGRFESSSYIDMTEAVIRAYDMGLAEKMIEADWSAGAMWVVANDILDGKLKIDSLRPESTQGDKRIINILNDYAIEEVYFEDRGKSNGITVDISDSPDIAPAIVLRAIASPLKTVITNAGRLRLKESDRLDAIVDIITKLGGDIRIGDDNKSLVINGNGGKLLPGSDEVISTCGDHRMVMLASFASILCEKPVKVGDAESVSKSYPEFFMDIERLGGIAR